MERSKNKILARMLMWRISNPIYGFVFASFAVMASLVIKLQIQTSVASPPAFLLFSTAVVISAWLGGFFVGLYAILLSALFADYYFLIPFRNFGLADSGQVLRISLFVMDSFIVTVLCAGFRNLLSKKEELIVRESKAVEARITTEKQLETSHRRFTSLFEESPVPIIIFKHDGTVIQANLAWEKLFDTKRSELTGYNVLLDPQAKALGIVDKVQAAFAGVTSVNLEPFPYDPTQIGKVGRPRWIQAVAFPLRIESGQAQEVALFEEDVTERMEAIETLKASEENFRLLADTLPTLVWSATPERKADYVNKAWLRFTGQSIEEATGRGWMKCLDPDDLPALAAAYEKAAPKRLPYEVEYRLKNFAGKYHWFHVLCTPRFAKNGEFKGYVGTCTDITEMKRAAEIVAESERYYRFLAEASGVLTQSLDHEVILKNLARLSVPTLADWCTLGLIQPDNSIRTVAVAHANPAKNKDVEMYVREYPASIDSPYGIGSVIRSGKPEMVEFVNPELVSDSAKDARHLEVMNAMGFYSYICVPLKGRERVFGAIVFMRTNDSKKKFTQTDFQIAKEIGLRAGLSIDNAKLYSNARIANQMKDEFLATLSHELRTPLNVIMGHSELLMSEGRDLPEFDSSIEAIYRNASAQTQIIKDILDVSSIVTGKVNLEKTDVSLGEIIAGSLHSIDLAASAKSIKVTASLPDAPIFSFADPVRIQQVFWNLLTNAVKFTPANGTIHLSLEKAGAFAQIKVKDSGRGIDTDFLPYVFDRFRQEDSTLTRSYGGLGLGLSIVKSITDAHGGDVSVYSDGKGKGTEFTVSIPISPRSESLVSNGVSDEQKEIPKDTLSGVRILAIDDESDNRTIVKRFLERAGADVTLASSAQAALKILEASNFDFILSDISMPEMDGFAFIEALRSLESNRGLKPTPAGALTAYARDEEKERALQAGFQIHVAKPISQRTLISSVRVGLQMKSEEASR